MVRPSLEYASAVWDPYSQKDIDKLEKVQRRGARFVLNRYRNTSSVCEMIDTLGWQPLEERRRNARLSMLYKTLKGPFKYQGSQHFSKIKNQTQTSTSKTQNVRPIDPPPPKNSSFLPHFIFDIPPKKKEVNTNLKKKEKNNWEWG